MDKQRAKHIYLKSDGYSLERNITPEPDLTFNNKKES